MTTSRKPRVFVSRTTAGLGPIAEKVAQVLRERGFDVVHQPDFTMSWRKVRHMLMATIRECDCVVCLIGPVYGAAPRQPIREFTDPNTGRNRFAYTQIEYLIARRLQKPIMTVLLSDTFPFEPYQQSDDDGKLQSDFIREYVKKDEHVRYAFATEAELLDALRKASIPMSLLPPMAPENVPFKSIGTLFTGRAETIRTIRDSLRSAAQADARNPPVQVIYGLGGVGKTRVAVEFAHAHEHEYAARLFVRGSSPGVLDDSLAQLSGLFVLNLEEQDEKETSIRVDAVLRWLDAHPGYLLVIDNVDTEAARNAVVELLPRLRHGHVLITSRLHTWPGNVLRFPLSVLSDRDSAALLLGYRASPKAPADTDEMDALALARDLDGLALALEQAAAYLNTTACTIAEYHRRWKKNMAHVHEWHDKERMDYPASVATTWLTSFDQLYPASQTLLRCLSWLAPDPIPRALLSSIKEGPSSPDPLNGMALDKALGELVNYCLVAADVKTGLGGRALAVHRVVQQITREQQTQQAGADVKGKVRSSGAIRRLSTLIEKVSRGTRTSTVPPALGIALRCVNLGWISGKPATYGEENPHSDEIRTWPALVPLVQHAIAVANFAADHDVPEPSGNLLSDAALLLHAQANYRAAEPVCLRALRLSRTAFGDRDPRVASCLGSLGQLLADTERYSRAEPMLRRALEIDERHFGSHHPKVSVRLNNLAQLLVATGRRNKAEPYMRRALAIDEKWFKHDHPNVAIRLNNLAQLLAETDRRTEAIPLLCRALAIDEKSCGSEHPNVAIRLANLAQLTDNAEEGEAMLQRALKIDKHSLGPDHPSVAKDLNNLAQFFRAANRMHDAEQMMRDALRIAEACFTPSHSTIALYLNNLAQLLLETGRPAEVEPLMRRALAIDESRSRYNRLNVATGSKNLALLFQSMNRPTEAEPLMHRAISIEEQLWGQRHPVVAASLGILAQLLQCTGRLDEAEAMMRRALSIDEEMLGASHPAVARDLSALGNVLKTSGQFSESQRCLRRALAIDEQQFPPDHPNVVADLKDIGKLLQASGQAAEAEPMMRRAMQIDEQRFGKDHPIIGEDLDSLADILRNGNRRQEAEKHMRRALGIGFRSAQATGHEDSAQTTRVSAYKQIMSELGRTQADILSSLHQIAVESGVSNGQTT